MSDTETYIVAMADKCIEMISTWNGPGADQPASLKPEHLGWMCRQVARHANDWPDTKVHRWIGFVQGAMIANHIITLEGARRMFDEAKNAFADIDRDLVDHLDPDSSFQLDIGGQG